MKSATLISISTYESTKPSSALQSLQHIGIYQLFNIIQKGHEVNQQLIMPYIYIKKAPKREQ